MNLRLMAQNIKQFVPQLSVPVIKQRVNLRYQQILGLDDWEFLNAQTTLRLIGKKSSTGTESCSCVNGSKVVTGSTTGWTSALEGQLVRFDDERQPYVVEQILGIEDMRLASPYGGLTGAGKGFSYWPRIYTPASGDVGKVLSITYDSELKEVPLEWINRTDPGREYTGGPQYWCVDSKVSSKGVVNIEFWPVVDVDYVVTVFYKKTMPELVEDTDEPVFRPEVVEAGALWDCYRIAYGMTQNPAFIGMARDAQKEYQILLRNTLIEDLHISSLPSRVQIYKGAMAIDDNFALAHDVHW